MCFLLSNQKSRPKAGQGKSFIPVHLSTDFVELEKIAGIGTPMVQCGSFPFINFNDWNQEVESERREFLMWSIAVIFFLTFRVLFLVQWSTQKRRVFTESKVICVCVFFLFCFVLFFFSERRILERNWLLHEACVQTNQSK